MVAAILFNALSWLVPASILALIAGSVLLWGYRRTGLPSSTRTACLLLKLLGIAALVFCLLEPMWVTERARSGANFFLVLADNSLSLQIKDEGNPRSRGEDLKKYLTEDSAIWQDTLAKDFQVRRYAFDSKLQRVESFSELTLDGKATSFGSALGSLKDRFLGQPLAGILLFSDGNFTDLPKGLTQTNGLPPIYPVVAGKDLPPRDVSLTAVSATQTAFEDAPVTAQAEVTAYGYAGTKITAELQDLSGKVMAKQTETAQGAEAKLAFRFQFRPEKSGLSYYRVRVGAQEEWTQFTDAKTSREATLVNNSRVFSVDRGQEPFRVLYVAGRPNWEYKFLRRALEDDPQVQLVGMIRVARREPKFEFKGRGGESSNPLFRGFGNQSKEEIERYDQPVLVRLNTRDENELRGGFPKLPEDLFSYHAIILDDLESEFFTPDQMQLIQKFVSLRGGGLLMLGGAESFQQGKYQRTPIGDLLPVYLDNLPAGPPATNQLKLTLTREGMLQPWARLRSVETDEQSRLRSMPGFQVLNRVRDFKPGATVVATVQDPQGTVYPAIVVQRFGNGRVGAVTIGDVWKWGLADAELHKDMDKSWRQLVRWLVADVPKRIDLETEADPTDANQAVTLKVRARTKDFQPLDNASVSISVRAMGQPGTNVSILKLPAEPSPTEPGVYQATYVPREPGAYEAEGVVVSSAGLQEGKTAAGWAANLGNDEFISLKPDRAGLERLARMTGGEMVAAEGLERFVRDLPNKKMPLMESASAPLWHRSIIFLFALACFIAEWGLRRWKGLA